jgi:hypothetical protein
MNNNVNLNTNSYQTTIFGSPITTNLGKLVRFSLMDRDTSWKKVSAFALGAFVVVGSAIAAGSGLLGLGYGAFYIGFKASMPITLKIASLFATGFVGAIGSGLMHAGYTSISNEIKCHQNNKNIVDALGGLPAFNALPEVILTSRHHYLDTVTPEDVQQNRISRGVDGLRRPFVAFLVKDVFTQSQHVEIIHARHNVSDNGLWVSGEPRRVFTNTLISDNFVANLVIIRDLVAGVMVNAHRLVEAN